MAGGYDRTSNCRHGSGLPNTEAGDQVRTAHRSRLGPGDRICG